MRTIREILLLCRDEILGVALTLAVHGLVRGTPLLGRPRARRAARRLLDSYVRMVNLTP